MGLKSHSFKSFSDEKNSSSKVYYISWSAEDSTRLIAYRLSFRYQPIFFSKAWKLSNRSTNSRLWKVSNFIIFLRNTAHSIVEIPNSLSDRSTLSHDEPILSLPSRLLNRTLEKDFLNRTNIDRNFHFPLIWALLLKVGLPAPAWLTLDQPLLSKKILR